MDSLSDSTYMASWPLAFLPNEDYVSDGEEFDNILIAAIEKYERIQEEPPQPLSTVASPPLPAAAVPPLPDATLSMPPTTTSVVAPHPFPLLTRPSSSRYAQPKTDKEIREARKNAIPSSTQQDTKYCIRLWEDWTEHRQSSTGATIKPITDMSPIELQHWLTQFILEIRKRDGSEYTPNSLHHIIAGIMRHLRLNGQPSIDFFQGSDFSEFRQTLDAEMKRIQGLGVGSKKKQAEIITEEEEELLWEKGLLGDSTPESLLNTVIFYNGLYFALRSGKEHRQLRYSPCQIQVIEQPGQRAYLQYTEDVSKNHPGGLRGRKITPKCVVHHSNTENTKRCFVTIFKKYRQLCPQIQPPSNAFYLQPLRSPTPTCWYSTLPLGHSKLGSTVARLCKEAGVQGYKTNHSLRATITSRMYHAGVEEQMIMERTGHRSTEGVRSYKRTSDKQRQALSDLLNHTEASHCTAVTSQPSASTTVAATSSQNAFHAVSNQQQLHAALSLPSVSFNNCTVNFYLEETTSKKPKRRRRAIVLDDSDSD